MASAHESKTLKGRSPLFEKGRGVMVISKQGEQSKDGGSNPFDVILGSSLEIIIACNLAKRAARGDSTVLIMGETGVGKSIFAKAIHKASRRATAPFVTCLLYTSRCV